MQLLKLYIPPLDHPWPNCFSPLPNHDRIFPTTLNSYLPDGSLAGLSLPSDELLLSSRQFDTRFELQLDSLHPLTFPFRFVIPLWKILIFHSRTPL